MGEHGFELRITAGECIADDGEVGFGVEILFCVSFVKDDPLVTEKVGHGGVDGLVGSGDLQPQGFEHRGDGAHTRSCDTEEVEVF